MTTPPPAAQALPSEASPEVSIRLDGISKAYKLYGRPFNFFKEALTGRPYHRDKVVLSDVSLTLQKGDILGIIGRNGAGKSTLLKIIAGTLAPSQGTVAINGRVAAILELGTGFNPNYSGRDNVIMSALMRGMSEDAVRRKFDSIVAFAALEDVIDEPFHTYSSGMQARLAFAAATAVEADVLVIDEALAAGDIRFASRSLRRIHEICQSGVTALFVSHVTYHVLQLCSRAIWIDEGRVRMDGPPVDVVRAYEYAMHEEIARDDGRLVSLEAASAKKRLKMVPEAEASGPTPAPADLSTPAGVSGSTKAPAPGPAEKAATPAEAMSPKNAAAVPEPATVALEGLVASGSAATVEHFSTGQYRIGEILFLNKDGERSNTFRLGEPMRMQVFYECLAPELPEYSCGLAVAFNRVSDFEAVMYYNTNYPHSDEELRDYFSVPFRKYRGRAGKIEAVIDPVQLRAGEYFVSLGILPNQPGAHEFYEYIRCHCRINIVANGFDEPSVFYPVVQWTNGPVKD